MKPKTLLILVFTFICDVFLVACINQKPVNRGQSKTETREINDGYGIQDGRNYTGSADEVNNDRSNNIPLDMHLKGLAGVTVQGSGANAKVLVRGVNSFLGETEPLFVVNNMVVNGGYSAAYLLLNANDIKSVTVLKDASSASIYGVRGANGVIIITMKN